MGAQGQTSEQVVIWNLSSLENFPRPEREIPPPDGAADWRPRSCSSARNSPPSTTNSPSRASTGQLTAKPQSGSPIAGANPSFQGGYVDFFWSPTGDSRAYKLKDGAFSRMSPRNPLGDHGLGALTPGVRYDFLDLTDGVVDGGEQKGFTLQSTWQPLAFLKFQADYSRLDIERPSSLLSGEADIITLRSQIEW